MSRLLMGTKYAPPRIPFSGHCHILHIGLHCGILPYIGETLGDIGETLAISYIARLPIAGSIGLIG